MNRITQLKAMTSRVQDTLVQDVIGAAALVVMLVVCLHLPDFI
jgi:hypothetical protein